MITMIVQPTYKALHEFILKSTGYDKIKITALKSCNGLVFATIILIGE